MKLWQHPVIVHRKSTQVCLRVKVASNGTVVKHLKTKGYLEWKGNGVFKVTLSSTGTMMSMEVKNLERNP
jgi:hypothetical protein